MTGKEKRNRTERLLKIVQPTDSEERARAVAIYWFRHFQKKHGWDGKERCFINRWMYFKDFFKETTIIFWSRKISDDALEIALEHYDPKRLSRYNLFKASQDDLAIRRKFNRVAYPMIKGIFEEERPIELKANVKLFEPYPECLCKKV